MHSFGVVHAQRTSSNLLEPHHHRESRACSVLSYEFRVVRRYRTFSKLHRYKGNKVCRVLVDAFGVVQVHRPSLNLLEPQQRRASTVCRVSSQEFSVVRLYGTFSTYNVTEAKTCAKPSLHTSSQKKHGVQRVVHEVGVVQEQRTSSNPIMPALAWCVEVFHRSSGWFDCTEPSLTTAFQGKHGVQGARARARGGSSASNLLEPSRTTS